MNRMLQFEHVCSLASTYVSYKTLCRWCLGLCLYSNVKIQINTASTLRSHWWGVLFTMTKTAHVCKNRWLQSCSSSSCSKSIRIRSQWTINKKIKQSKQSYLNIVPASAGDHHFVWKQQEMMQPVVEIQIIVWFSRFSCQKTTGTHISNKLTDVCDLITADERERAPNHRVRLHVLCTFFFTFTSGISCCVCQPSGLSACLLHLFDIRSDRTNREVGASDLRHMI